MGVVLLTSHPSVSRWQPPNCLMWSPWDHLSRDWGVWNNWTWNNWKWYPGSFIEPKRAALTATALAWTNTGCAQQLDSWKLTNQNVKLFLRLLCCSRQTAEWSSVVLDELILEVRSQTIRYNIRCLGEACRYTTMKHLTPSHEENDQFPAHIFMTHSISSFWISHLNKHSGNSYSRSPSSVTWTATKVLNFPMINVKYWHILWRHLSVPFSFYQRCLWKKWQNYLAQFIYM